MTQNQVREGEGCTIFAQNKFSSGPLPRLVAWCFRLSSSLTAQSAWYLETRI